MTRIPQPIVNLRVIACRACEHHAAPWHCALTGGDVSAAIKTAEIGQCPLGLHPNGDAVPRPPEPAKPKAPGGRQRFGVGAIGIASWLFSLCPVLPEITAFRRSQCRTCVKRKRFLWVFRVCSACGCWLRAKTAVGSQRCPDKRWEAVHPEGCISIRVTSSCGGCGGQ